jgi:hypothetical protein
MNSTERVLPFNANFKEFTVSTHWLSLSCITALIHAIFKNALGFCPYALKRSGKGDRSTLMIVP